ncbi:MAG: hypothetical protein HYV01_08700 [Deltaproteobacteria bacterium]|nr:hypothetical protein [Deltaproteobacteria bacterium]
MPLAVIIVRKISRFLNAGTRRGKEIVMQSRLIKPGLVAVILLFLLAGLPAVPAQAGEPWEFLEDFALVPGAVSRVEDGYVAAVFHSSEKGLFALIIFPGVCGSQSCNVKDPVAYFVVDTKGLLVKLHVEPGTELSLLIAGFQSA